MKLQRKTNRTIYFLILLFGIFWLIYSHWQAEVPAAPGDGISHFFISNASWQQPLLFLDHWGKPLFTLLSSPFAQFGFGGVVLFNILVFTASAWVAYKLMQRLNVHPFLTFLFVPALLLANDIPITIIGGLTEPLFNFVLLLAAYFLVKKNWLVTAIIISFMPFMRSEGQLPVLIAVIIFIYSKQWKYLPFLATGFLLYALVGRIAIGDFFWYFNNSPYAMNNDIYGSGTWNHYFVLYQHHLGKAGLYLTFAGAISASLLLIKKQWKELHFDLSFFAYATYLGILFSHAYFWATGQNGSAGLTRLATQGIPLFLVVQLAHISSFSWVSKRISCTAFGLTSLFLVYSVFSNKRFPLQASSLEKTIIKAAEDLTKTESKEDAHFYYYHHPLLAYQLNLNPFADTERCLFYYGYHLKEDVEKKFNAYDFLIWDNYFCPVDGGMPLEKIRKIKSLVEVKRYEAGESAVYVFQKIPEEEQQEFNTITIDVAKNRSYAIQKEDLYTNLKWDELKDGIKYNLNFTIVTSCEKLRLSYDNQYTNVLEGIMLQIRKTEKI